MAVVMDGIGHPNPFEFESIENFSSKERANASSRYFSHLYAEGVSQSPPYLVNLKAVLRTFEGARGILVFSTICGSVARFSRDRSESMAAEVRSRLDDLSTDRSRKKKEFNMGTFT